MTDRDKTHYQKLEEKWDNRTLDEAIADDMKSMREYAANNEIPEILYDNTIAICLTNSSKGEYSDSVTSSLLGNEKHSGQEQRDTLLKHTRLDVALLCQRVERIIKVVKRDSDVLAVNCWLMFVLIIMNVILIYKVWL